MPNYNGNKVTVGYAAVTRLTAGVTLPAATLNVEDTSLLPASGSVTIGAQTVAYTGKTGTTLTGATGGTGAVAAGTDVIGAYTDITAYINDTGMEMSLDEGEATKQNSTWKEWVPGLAEGSVSFTVFHEDLLDFASQPQNIIESLMGKFANWRIREQGAGSGKPERLWKGFVKSIKPNLANDSSVVSSECEVRVTGAPTSAGQS